MWPLVSPDHGGSSPGAVIETSWADQPHTIGHHSVESQPLSREVVTLRLNERHESKQTLPQVHHHGPNISDMHHGGPGGSEGGQPGVRGLQWCRGPGRPQCGLSGASEHRADGRGRRDRHQRRGGGRQPRQGQRVRRHAPGKHQHRHSYFRAILSYVLCFLFRSRKFTRASPLQERTLSVLLSSFYSLSPRPTRRGLRWGQSRSPAGTSRPASTPWTSRRARSTTCSWPPSPAPCPPRRERWQGKQTKLNFTFHFDNMYSLDSSWPPLQFSPARNPSGRSSLLPVPTVVSVPFLSTLLMSPWCHYDVTMISHSRAVIIHTYRVSGWPRQTWRHFLICPLGLLRSLCVLRSGPGMTRTGYTLTMDDTHRSHSDQGWHAQVTLRPCLG